MASFPVGHSSAGSLHKKRYFFRVFEASDSLRTADVFPVVASLPPKNKAGERER